jgi:hypothetical protein
MYFYLKRKGILRNIPEEILQYETSIIYIILYECTAQPTANLQFTINDQ